MFIAAVNGVLRTNSSSEEDSWQQTAWPRLDLWQSVGGPDPWEGLWEMTGDGKAL